MSTEQTNQSKRLFALYYGAETSPSIVGSYYDCLEYAARICDSRDLYSDNGTPRFTSSPLEHIGCAAPRRVRDLAAGKVEAEHLTGRLAFTGEPITLTIKYHGQAPYRVQATVLKPLISVRLCDTGADTRPTRSLKKVDGHRPAVLI